MPRRAASIPAAVFLAALAVCHFCIGPAFGHASLVGVSPADGAIVEAAPATVVLEFSEPVTPLVARLTHPDGRVEILDDIGARDREVLLRLPAGLEQGTHTVSWRVTSQDGHPIGGGSQFSIGSASTTRTALPVGADPLVRVGLWVARFALMIGLSFGVGAIAFAAIAGQASLTPVAGRIAFAALVAGLVGVPLLIGFQGLDALGEPVSSLAHLEVWRSGLCGTAYGRTAILAASAFLAAYAARRLGKTAAARWSSGIGLALAGLAVAASGHASTAPPEVLTRPAVFAHAAAMALWVGALLPLAFSLRQSAPRTLLESFSRAIPVIVVLIASGVLLAVVQLRSVEALWTTAYGQVLVAKLALVSVMLLLGAFNRYRLTQPALAGDARATRRLVRSIAVETLVACLVLAVVGLWRFTPPPRALAAEPPAASHAIEVEESDITARLTLTPSETGPVRVEVASLRRAGTPFEPKEITVELDKPAMGIGPFSRPARKAGDDLYVADGFVLPMDGPWVVRVKLLVSDFESVTLTDAFEVTSAGTRVPTR